MKLRLSIWLAAVATGALLSGCGGGGAGQTRAERATLPAALATSLAATSESIADLLDAGDVCQAARRADELKNAVDAAVDAGQVPASLQGELETAATDLQNDVNCPPPKEEDEHDKGQGKGKNKDTDTTTLGVTITTEGGG